MCAAPHRRGDLFCGDARTRDGQTLVTSATCCRADRLAAAFRWSVGPVGPASARGGGERSLEAARHSKVVALMGTDPVSALPQASWAFVSTSSFGPPNILELDENEESACLRFLLGMRGAFCLSRLARCGSSGDIGRLGLIAVEVPSRPKCSDDLTSDLLH